MQTQLNTTQKFTLAVVGKDVFGNVVSLSSPSWSSSDSSIAALTVAADGMSAEVVSGSVGTATITVSCDGLTATDEVTVIAAPAAVLELTATDPVAK